MSWVREAGMRVWPKWLEGAFDKSILKTRPFQGCWGRLGGREAWITIAQTESS